MPIYLYKCQTCQHQFERIRSVSAMKDLSQCGQCQGERIAQVMTVPGGIRANGKDGGMVLSEAQMKKIKEPVWQDTKTGAITSAH